MTTPTRPQSARKGSKTHRFLVALKVVFNASAGKKLAQLVLLLLQALKRSKVCCGRANLDHDKVRDRKRVVYVCERRDGYGDGEMGDRDREKGMGLAQRERRKPPTASDLVPLLLLVTKGCRWLDDRALLKHAWGDLAWWDEGNLEDAVEKKVVVHGLNHHLGHILALKLDECKPA